MSSKELENLLNEIYCSMRNVFGNKLVSVILYGSYARGDYDIESDIDIAVIADVPREKLIQYRHTLVSQMTHFMMDYGILVSLTEIPIKDFDEYKDILPYYRNIVREGVQLSA